MKKLISLIIFCTALFFACNNSTELNRIISRMPSVTDSKYTRDSLYLCYTVKEFIENDYEDYHYVYMFGKQNFKKINIYVDNIFYSQDTTKLIAFIILEIPVSIHENKNSLEDPNKEYCYDGLVLSSIKDSLNEYWDVYCLSIYRPMNYSSHEKVRYMLRNFFINEFKETNGHDFNCNLNEACFWTDTNSVWRKGDVIPDYYNFQINTNKYYYERDKHKEELSTFLVPRLDIEYPKELLEQYK
ncbi:MAG: hypothetical protein QM503_04760 [Bacteroidota bacterium]